MKSIRWSAVLFFALFVAVSAGAASDFKVLIDADDSAATGCSVQTTVGRFDGVEHILTTTVDTVGGATRVIGVSRQQCVDGATNTFSAAVAVDTTGWAVPVDSHGRMVIETHVPFSALSSSPITNAHVAFIATSGTLGDVILSDTSSAAIHFPPRTIGRRRVADTDRNIVMDGDLTEWGLIAPLVTGDASTGTAAFRFMNVYGTVANMQWYFAFEVRNNRNAPTAIPDNYAVLIGKALNIAAPGILGNDLSPTGAPLTAILIAGPQHGALTLNANGSFSYIHDGSNAPQDSFTYKANNGSDDSNTALVRIDVTHNVAPVAHNDSYSVAHRGVLTVPAPGVLANDTDADGDPLRAQIVTQPLHGFVTLNLDGSFTYTHNGSNSLSDSFLYRASDGVSNSSPATVSITIAPDLPPVAVADSYSVAEGGTLNVAAPGLFVNDTDPDTPQTAWTAVVGTLPAHGTLTMLPGGAFTYVHDGSETVADSFTYQVNDGIASSAPVTVTITVTPVNDAPVAVADPYTTLEDQALTIPALTGVLANDTDVDTAHAALTAVLVANVQHGTLTLNPNGSFTYNPTANYNGVDTFTYKANDGQLDSNVVTVTITITAVNDVPSFATGGDVTVPEDAGAQSLPWATALSTGPADEVGQTLNFIVTNNNNALFSVQPAISPAGVLTFTPVANANGPATVQVTLHDNGGVANGGVDTSATITFIINVTAVNDAPSFVKGADQTVLEDATAQTVNGWATSLVKGPADEVGQTLNFIVTNNNNALFSAQPSIDAAGNLTYTPAANANGTATVTVAIHDNGGTANGGVDTSATQTFVINVTAVNDVPSFAKGADVTVIEDSGVSTTVGWATALSTGPADEATQTLSFNVTNNSNATLFSVQPAISANGTLTFTPAPDANGSATITINVQDNGGTANGGVDTSATQTFVINVTAVNDPPSFTKGANQTVLEDVAAQTVNGWATALSKGPADEAGQTLSFIVSNNNNGLFSVQPAIDASGNLTYTPAANAFGLATVTVQIHDDGGTANGTIDTSVAQTFTITITPVNDAPSFTKGVDQSVAEDSGLTTVNGWAPALSAGPVNESSQTLSFIVTNDNNALFSVQPAVDASGTLTFTTAQDASGTATVTIAIHDDGGTANGGVDTSATQTFTITLTPVNDAPILGGPSVTTNYTEGGASIFIDPTLTITDVDSAMMGGALVAISGNADGPGNDVLTFVNTATITGTFVPNAGTLSLTGTDTVAAYQAALRSIKYSSISDAPVLAMRYIDYTVTDNLGATSTNKTNFVTITETNDAPVVTVPNAQATIEDQPLSITTITVADPDDRGAPNMRLDYSSTHGTLAFPNFAPPIAPTTSGSFFGDLTTINGALAGGLVFTPDPDFAGTAKITITINDQGNSGGGALTDTKTIDVVVTGINDTPVFTKGADQVVLEDSGLHTVNGWATGMSAGPADEAGQTLNFIVTNDNNALFTVQPAVDASGNLTYTLAPNANGLATVSVQIHDNGGTANGAVDTSAVQTFTITVTDVNDAPSFTKGADQSVLEDSGAHTVNGWATAVSAGPSEGGQAVNFIVTNDNNALFSVQPAVDASGNLTYTLAADANGSAVVTVSIHDDGGTANGGVDTSATQSFNILVTMVNDAPSFTKGADQTVLEDSGLHTVNGWATALSAGPADEAGQALNFIVSNNNNALFSIQPAVDASGNLTYTLAANANGVATVTVQIHDNGGTASGGVDTSAAQTFDINVTNVNDAPSFTKGADQTVLEDAAPVTVNGWATALNAGPGEAGQTLNFIVSNNNNALFSVQPAVDATGNLTYTLAANANGSALVTIAIHDNGGTANGGVDTSANQTFNINVTAVNDAPSFTKGADQSAFEDSGLHTVNGWATALSAGPADEAGQTLSFNVSNNNNALFSVQPAVSPAGVLTYTAAANATGTATVTLSISDNGGTANGGVNTSANQTFDITITGVNDAPSFTKGADQTVLEDAAPVTVNGWATAISAGPNEGGQTVNFIVSNNNNTLFSVQPAVSAAGVLTYTLAADANGSALVTIAIHDDGGTANGGVDTSANQTFNINVTPVNDAPSFTKGADETVLEDSGLHTVNGWATAIAKGPADESTQTVSFNVSNNNNGLFAVQPAVSPAGVLTYTLAANASGSATVTISITDNGGTANGGVNTSANQTFAINVTNVNDAPSFTKGADQTLLEDAAPVTVNGWATAISAGPSEGAQTVNFIVSNNNNGLFSVQPAVSANGALTYTLAANANGSALVTVAIHDDGGTANGGVDTSANQTFNINVTAVNDAPSFTFAAGHVFTLKDTGSNSLPNWVQNRSKGPADENGQTLTGHMTNDNNALFSVQPSVDMTNGWVNFTTAAGATGTATVSLFVTDDGGTANGGVDTTATQTFTLTIEAEPSVISTNPSTGGTIARAASVTVNFSEPVNATTASFTVSCAGTPQVFTISASPASSFTLTPDVSQGSLWTAGTCSATVLAAGITDVDTDDPPNAMAANYNFTFITNTPPIANPDTYSAIGNVTVTIPVGTGLLANDTDPDAGQTLSATAGTFATVNGGSITIAADGSFTYHTLANANSGSDSYTYTLSDGSTTTTGTVTFNISGRYIYVQHDAPAGGDGRDVTPYQTITAAEAVAAANDTILVLTGGAGALDEGATLKSGQVLIGQGITTALTTTLNTQTVTLLATGSSGLITRTTAGTALTLNSGNTVKGLTVTANNGTALSGTTFGTLTTDLLLLAATNGPAMNLTTGAFAAGSVLTSVASTNSTTTGVSLTTVTGSVTINGGTISGSTTSGFAVSGGSVSVTTSNAISAAAGSLVSVTGSHTGTLTFQTGTLSATGGTGLQLTAANGTYNFNGTTTLNGGAAQVSVGGTGTFTFSSATTVTSPTAAAFAATGSPNVTYSGSLSQSTANALVAVTNTTGGTITFQTGTLGASAGTGIVLNNADGAINFNSASTTLNGVNGYSITAGSSGTYSFSNTHSITSTGVGFTVDTSNPTFTYPGNITTNASRVVLVNALSGGAVTFSGNLTSGTAGTPTGLGLTVTSCTGGTVTFSGASKSFFTAGNVAVTLTTNTGATINFTGGGLAITTTTGNGFVATGGGTVSVTGSPNTVASAGGVPVTITSTTIGASGVTFFSVNATGGTSGIALTSTGNTGAFSVTGDGATAGTGGTIQTTTVAGVSLTTMTGTTSLAFMNLTTPAGGPLLSGTTFGTLSVNALTLTSNVGTIATLTTGTLNGTFTSINGTVAGNNVGIILSAVAGNFTISGGTITSGGGATTPDLVQITGGNATINWNGTLVSNKAARMVNVSGTNTGTVTFGGALTGSGGSLGLVFTSANGTYAINPSAVANFSGAANALSIFTSSGSFTTSANLAPVNTTGTAVRIGDSSIPTAAGTPTVLWQGPISQNAAPRLVEIHGVSGGSTAGVATPYSIRFNGTITKTGALGTGINVSTITTAVPSVGFVGDINLTTGTGNAITVTSSTGGSTNFTGDVTITTTTGVAVSLTTNTGHTINYSPAVAANNITITTGTGNGYSATGGGTVNVLGTSNTVTSVGGAAVNIASTTIGASNVTFRSVTATGGTNGIVLNATGATGALIVTGNAGTCFNLASTCTGGVISNSTGSGISLTSTLSPSFSFMKINNTALSGVRGTLVTNFTMASSVIDGVNTSHTADDSNIGFNNTVTGTDNNITGNVSITNCVLNNSYQHGIDISQYAGTITQLTITNNSFTSPATGSSFGSAIRIQMLGSASTGANLNKASINNNFMRNFPAGDGVIINAGNSVGGPSATAGNSGNATNVINIKNNDIQGASAAAYMLNAVAVAVNKGGSGNFNIDSNGTAAVPVKFIGGNGVSCGAFGSVTVTCTINNNYFDLFNIANSAGINIGGDQGTAAVYTDSPQLIANVTANTVKDCDGNGILATMKQTAGLGKFAIQNNIVDPPLHTNPGFTSGIRVDSGVSTGGTDSVCLNISGNTSGGDSTAGGTLAPGIIVRHEHSSGGRTFGVHGFTPSSAAASEAEMITFISAANPNSAVGTAGTKVVSQSSGGTFSNCTYIYP
jgi:VCBS repeat-containing protein